MAALEQMKSVSYKENINKQIEIEKQQNHKLLSRASQLEKQIKVLIDDSVALLKARMNELGISTTSQNDLLCKAKEIVGRHKELQVMAAKLQNQVNVVEQEQKSLVYNHIQRIAEKYIKSGNSEITPATSHELVLKEIANTLAYRKKLHAQVSNLESELSVIEKVSEDKKGTIVMGHVNNPIPMQQQINPQTGNISNSSNSNSSGSGSSNSSSNNSSSNNFSSTKISSGSSKSSRKNREHRTRSQEWPDVPDVGKIEENNPEILAQKILETGRQIEAGKLLMQKNKEKSGVDNALMPAPASVMKLQNKNPPISSKTSPQNNTKIAHESPKVVNFEDRLKSIITSALNEDQEQRKAQDNNKRVPNVNVPVNLLKTEACLANLSTNIQNIVTLVNTPSIATATTTHINGNVNVNYKGHSGSNNNNSNGVHNGKIPSIGSSSKKNLNTSSSSSLSSSSNISFVYPTHQNISTNYSHPQSKSNDLFPDEHQINSKSDVHKTIENFRRQVNSPIEDYPRTNSAELSRGNVHLQQPTRPGSSSSQPDYTQVSPAKMALRRHLSQEKISSQQPTPMPGMSTVKTIGDLVNGEIERTLEISNQSIINAAVNMSTMLTSGGSGGGGGGSGKVQNPNQSVINWNAQRPERVSIRVADEHQTFQNQFFNMNTTGGNSKNSLKTTNPNQIPNNLCTLPHANSSYSQKQFNQNEVKSNLRHISSSNYSTTGTPKTKSSYHNSSRHQMDNQSVHLPQNRNDHFHALPRSDLKPYLETYFNEEQKPVQLMTSSTVSTGNEDRLQRLSSQPPLEGTYLKKIFYFSL